MNETNNKDAVPRTIVYNNKYPLNNNIIKNKYKDYVITNKVRIYLLVCNFLNICKNSISLNLSYNRANM